jgi:hypothetical protein
MKSLEKLNLSEVIGFASEAELAKFLDENPSTRNCGRIVRPPSSRGQVTVLIGYYPTPEAARSADLAALLADTKAREDYVKTPPVDWERVARRRFAQLGCTLTQIDEHIAVMRKERAPYAPAAEQV